MWESFKSNIQAVWSCTRFQLFQSVSSALFCLLFNERPVSFHHLFSLSVYARINIIQGMRPRPYFCLELVTARYCPTDTDLRRTATGFRRLLNPSDLTTAYAIVLFVNNVIIRIWDPLLRNKELKCRRSVKYEFGFQACLLFVIEVHKEAKICASVVISGDPQSWTTSLKDKRLICIMSVVSEIITTIVYALSYCY